MSWMAKLYDTYETGMGLDLPGENKLMPISHTLQNTHINIVITDIGKQDVNKTLHSLAGQAYYLLMCEELDNQDFRLLFFKLLF